MNPVQTIFESVIQSPEPRPEAIVRGTVIAGSADGTVAVDCGWEESGQLRCDVLQTSQSPPTLAPGDTVLVWLPSDDRDYGVVLGRIGPGRHHDEPKNEQDETPDHIVIEAKKNLAFKCGQGSITIRGDGKILIKGKDLVSRAQRVNRIKGGSVSIN